MLPAARLQLAGELPVAAQQQVRSGPGFDRHQGQLVQLRPLGVSEAGVGEFGQRLAPPQAKRLAQRGRSLRHLARLRQAWLGWRWRGVCSAGPGWYAGSGGGLGVQAVGEGGVAAAGALGPDGGGQGAAGSC